MIPPHFVLESRLVGHELPSELTSSAHSLSLSGRPVNVR
jgi:hypothetical protein